MYMILHSKLQYTSPEEALIIGLLMGCVISPIAIRMVKMFRGRK